MLQYSVETQVCFTDKNQLHVSANNGSHHQDDHKNIKNKCLQPHWWLELSNLANAVLCNIHNMQNTKLQE
jgi:hypothetical protein